MTSWPALDDELRRKSGRNVEPVPEPEPSVVGQSAAGRAGGAPPRTTSGINAALRDALAERRNARGGSSERPIKADDLFRARR